MDPMRFLTGHAPFSELGAEGRRELERRLEITWARNGERLVTRAEQCEYLFIVRQGSVRLELDGQHVEGLGSGEIFGLGSVTQKQAQFDAIAATDCLLYRIPGEEVRRLFEREPGFAGFFLQELSERLRALSAAGPVSLQADLNVPVGELVTRAPVTAPLTATAGEVARLMDAEGVSSVLLYAAGGSPARPEGIVTDRDLRARVLARGLGPETPARQIMSAPVSGVDRSSSSTEAVLELLRLGVHHLAVLDGQEVIGVLAHSDVLRHRRRGPAALLRTIEKARSAQDLRGYAEDVTGMVESLYRGRVEASDIGRLVAALGDALTGRLLSQAEAALGPPPCAYAWIAFGSEGRREQSLLTDQDNALIYAEAGAEADDYFGLLAERVVGDLVEVGYPRCPGGFMATRWRKPLEAWASLFERWLEQPEPESLIEAANFFDFRVLHGDLSLEPLEQIIRRAAGNRLFLAHLARACFDMRPPLGLLQRIRESAEGVDLKAGALIPITSLARLFALEAGERHGSTLQRLETARRAGTLSASGAELLSEAFRFVFSLRLDGQLNARRAGLEPSNHVRLDALGPRRRRHLKDAFVAIDRLQTATGERLGTHRLG